MGARKDKYDAFSKVFAELSDESQDKLVKIAHRLLKTHLFTAHEIAIQTRYRKTKSRMEN